MYNAKSLKQKSLFQMRRSERPLAYADANKDNVEVIDQIIAKGKTEKG